MIFPVSLMYKWNVAHAKRIRKNHYIVSRVPCELSKSCRLLPGDAFTWKQHWSWLYCCNKGRIYLINTQRINYARWRDGVGLQHRSVIKTARAHGNPWNIHLLHISVLRNKLWNAVKSCINSETCWHFIWFKFVSWGRVQI